MANLDAVVTWVDARSALPSSGTPVAAAITGRYPADSDAESGGGPGTESDTAPGSAAALGEEFWLVRPMYFTTLHFGEDGTEHRNCFVDSDGVVRLPYGRPGDEPVTHWAALPTLPGMTVHGVLGEEARTALRNAQL